MSTRTFTVPDISCGHCQQTIEAEVGKLENVDTVAVAIDAKTVTVDGPASDAEIIKAIEDAGYEVKA